MAVRTLPSTYNSYDCARDRFKLYTPRDLEAMRRADREIDVEFKPWERILNERERYTKWYHEHKAQRAESQRRCYERRQAGIAPDPTKVRGKHIALTPETVQVRAERYLAVDRERNRKYKERHALMDEKGTA